MLPLGVWLGGAWTFMAAAATPLCLAALDGALGDEKAASRVTDGATARWSPRVYIVLQLAVTAATAIWITLPTTSFAEAVGAALSAGATTGVFGFVAAHEMIHSRSRHERALGLSLLASVFYMHFRIAHVYGHHRRAATFDDPATARLGEGLYSFLLRSIGGQWCESWAFEAKRLRRAGEPVISAGNRMIRYVVVEVAFFVAVGLASVAMLGFVVAVAMVSVALLESFNYVAHYGLVRRTGANGHREPLGPQHSWNSVRAMNNAALFNMGRHSDHHRHTTRPYHRLEPLDGAALLPAGYASALLTALIPPLWRRVMDPRVG